MSPRPDGRRSACTVTDAQARLHDAAAFLEAAQCLQDPDVAATKAIHAANDQAAYESRDVSVSEARMCVRQAELLVAAARQRVIAS
jgi:hypothetical protein